MGNETRRDFIKTAAAAAAAAMSPALSSSAPAATAAEQKRPRNVLFLMTDQHRPDALSLFGDPHAVTPALDSLAGSGTALRQAYCQDPVCVPSRNSILLGCYTHAHGALTNGRASRTDLLSFPQFLRSKGYKSACFGKLHVKGRS